MKGRVCGQELRICSWSRCKEVGFISGEETIAARPLRFDWQVISKFQQHLKSDTGNFPLAGSSNIWAAATRAEPTLSAGSYVLSDIKLPQLMGEFTPDSNYTSGLFSFAQLTDIPLTSGGVCALAAPLWVSFYCSDWLSSPLSSLASTQMRINSVSSERWGFAEFFCSGDVQRGGELNRKEGGRKKKRQREATFEFSICGEGESEGQKSENPALTRDKAKETSASLLRNPC